MTGTPRPQGPATYRIRVEGHLDDHWSVWLGGLALTHEIGGTTSLHGPVEDQAHLHGLLTKVRDLGITLISVEMVDPPARRPAQSSRGRPLTFPTEGGQYGARTTGRHRPMLNPHSPIH